MFAEKAVETAPPKVAVSIRPIHSLVSAVMRGVAKPVLLINHGGDPHSAGQRPSTVRYMNRADLVIWIGPDLESGLAGSVASLSRKTRRLTIMDLVTVETLLFRPNPLRRPDAGDWGDNDHGALGIYDPHVWLNPNNASVIVDEVTDALMDLDPKNAARYRANASRLQMRLVALDMDLRAALAGRTAKSFLTFHDGFQYFDRAYDLKWVGAVADAVGRNPGVRRIRVARQRILDGGAACLIIDPAHPNRLAATLLEGTTVGFAEMDPIGLYYRPGPRLYFQMMRGNARALIDCLNPTQR